MYLCEEKNQVLKLISHGRASLRMCSGRNSIAQCSSRTSLNIDVEVIKVMRQVMLTQNGPKMNFRYASKTHEYRIFIDMRNPVLQYYTLIGAPALANTGHFGGLRPS